MLVIFYKERNPGNLLKYKTQEHLIHLFNSLERMTDISKGIVKLLTVLNF